MIKFFRSVAPVAALTLLLSACGSSPDEKPASNVLASTCEFALTTTPNQMPNVKLPCITPTGYSVNPISLTSLKGPFVINLWGSWCPPCREEMPLFRKLYLATEKTKTLSLVGIDVEEATLKDGLDFMKAQGMVWPQLADNGQATRAAFGMGVPVTWFVDANGVVTYKKIGEIHSWTQMRGLISLHLGIDIAS